MSADTWTPTKGGRKAALSIIAMNPDPEQTFKRQEIRDLGAMPPKPATASELEKWQQLDRAFFDQFRKELNARTGRTMLVVGTKTVRICRPVETVVEGAARVIGSFERDCEKFERECKHARKHIEDPMQRAAADEASRQVRGLANFMRERKYN